ncbi:hypothetical protein [Streptomyces sp. NPDC000410]|uniref:hypothetical protein n=1 Tax=Streptomyces sp. NPDC000410 TaxID=3154254 RepID=UPI003325FEA1
MPKFNSYHWKTTRLTDRELEAAREELMDPSSAAKRLEAFLVLLRSEQSAAIGIALDHYHYATSRSRHGQAQPYTTHRGEVVERARDLLRHPPGPHDEIHGDFPGAEHASALIVLANEAGDQDAGLVANALDSASDFDTESAALQAAGRIFRWSDSPSADLIDRIARMVRDEDRDLDERLEALEALARGKDPRLLYEIAEITASDDVALQVTATHALAFHDMTTYRSLVEERLASWPEDAPYPATEVRELLQDDGS